MIEICPVAAQVNGLAMLQHEMNQVAVPVGKPEARAEIAIIILIATGDQRHRNEIGTQYQNVVEVVAYIDRECHDGLLTDVAEIVVKIHHGDGSLA
jgi:hypothetical protein